MDGEKGTHELSHPDKYDVVTRTMGANMWDQASAAVIKLIVPQPRSDSPRRKKATRKLTMGRKRWLQPSRSINSPPFATKGILSPAIIALLTMMLSKSRERVDRWVFADTFKTHSSLVSA